MSSSRKKKPQPLNEAYRAMLKTVKGGALGTSRQRLFTIRENIEHGDWPREDTMREHLRRAGWRMVGKELWAQ